MSHLPNPVQMESLYSGEVFQIEDINIAKQHIAIELVKRYEQKPTRRLQAVLKSLQVIALAVFMACLGAFLLLPVFLFRIISK